MKEHSSDDTVVVTEDLLRNGMSRNGRWDVGCPPPGMVWGKQQLITLGAKWPLRTGWFKKLIGSEIPRIDAEAFIKLKDAHLKVVA